MVSVSADEPDNSKPMLSRGGSGLAQLIRVQPYEAFRDSSSNVDITKNGDAQSIEPGGTLVLLDEKGPGVVTHFWNTVGSYDPFYARALVIRIYYDGMDAPSVEVPLGDFFGVGHAAMKDFSSLPVSTSSHGRSRTCYWHMPFGESIRITVTNENAEMKVDSFYYYINWRKLKSLAKDTVYFHAQYRQETPAKPGNYKILETTGRGHYVGTVLSVFQMETGWFGEGDDFFYIDNAKDPQLRGTGTEDYFNDSWGFREFDRPFHGVTLYDGVVVGDRVTAYRWHINDPIPFKESLRFEIEHKGSIFDEEAPLTSIEVGGFLDRYDWYSSVAFWYQSPPTSSTEEFPSYAERIPPYKMLMASDLKYDADPPLLVMPMEPAVMYIPGIPDGQITFTLDIPEDGFYRLDGIFMYSMMSGVYQPFMDDKPIGGPIDFGAVGMDPVWTRLDTHRLTKGPHLLKFKGANQPSKFRRNLAPAQDGLAIVGISLLHLDAMDGFKKALREARPK